MSDEILTVTIRVKDKKQLEWIWEALKGKKPLEIGDNRVTSASWGNLLLERDLYQDVANKAIEQAERSGDWWSDANPTTVVTADDRTFYAHPFGVYSESEKNYDGGEWFASLDDLTQRHCTVIIPKGNT